MSSLTYAFLLTLFAGLATGIGSAIAFFTKRTSPSSPPTSKRRRNRETNLRKFCSP